jgi:hypothetical protein
MPSILNTLPTAVKLKGPQTQITHVLGHGDVSIQQTRSLPTMEDITLPPQVTSMVSQQVWDANAQNPLRLNHVLLQVG